MPGQPRSVQAGGSSGAPVASNGATGCSCLPGCPVGVSAAVASASEGATSLTPISVTRCSNTKQFTGNNGTDTGCSCQFCTHSRGVLRWRIGSRSRRGWKRAGTCRREHPVLFLGHPALFLGHPAPLSRNLGVPDHEVGALVLGEPNRPRRGAGALAGPARGPLPGATGGGNRTEPGRAGADPEILHNLHDHDPRSTLPDHTQRTSSRNSSHPASPPDKSDIPYPRNRPQHTTTSVGTTPTPWTLNTLAI